MRLIIESALERHSFTKAQLSRKLETAGLLVKQAVKIFYCIKIQSLATAEHARVWQTEKGSN